jgi:hypothetical protein
VAARSTQAKHQLLNRQMAGVRREFLGIATSERNDQGSSQRGRDPLKGLEVRVGKASFDPTFDHPPETSAAGKLQSGQAAAFALALDLGADPSPHLLCGTI